MLLMARTVSASLFVLRIAGTTKLASTRTTSMQPNTSAITAIATPPSRPGLRRIFTNATMPQIIGTGGTTNKIAPINAMIAHAEVAFFSVAPTRTGGGRASTGFSCITPTV